jgi:hypothetical protein
LLAQVNAQDSSPRMSSPPSANRALKRLHEYDDASLKEGNVHVRLAILIVCVAVAVDAVRHGWLHAWDSPQVPRAKAPAAAYAIWLVLIAVVVVVQVAMFVSAPRPTYPTLSSLADLAFQAWPVRAAAFGLWSCVGWYLVRR